MRPLESDTRGAGYAEYLVIVACVALLGLSAWRTFGRSAEEKIATQGDCLVSMSSGCGSGAPTAYGSGVTPGGEVASAPEEEEEDEDDGCGWNPVCHAGNAVDATTDFVGDAAGFAWDVATDPRNPLIAVPLGVYDGTVGTIVGIGDALLHPIDTIQGLAYASSHPFETGYAFLNMSWDDFKENPVRTVSATATSLALGSVAAEAPTAVKVTEEVVSASKQGATAAEAGNEARDGDAPGFIKWADEWIAPSLSPAARVNQVLDGD